MKTSQLPPVRVQPSVRDEIEAALRPNESLSEFVEQAALQEARRRKAQADFLARGRTSLAKARREGTLRPVISVLDEMENCRTASKG